MGLALAAGCIAIQAPLKSGSVDGQVDSDTDAPSPQAEEVSFGGLPGANAKTCSLTFVDAPLQRLTRSQYAASVGDLLGVGAEQVVVDALPEDEVVGPFRANTHAAVGDLSLEQYQLAAQQNAALATGRLDALLPCAANQFDADCLGAFVERFGTRAFRRPLAEQERSRYRALAAAYAPGDVGAVGLMVQAFLQSPNFLYRPEGLENAPATAGGVDLSGHEIASRLSFFLWGRAPDDLLLKAAADGSLQTPAGLQGQVDRLTADRRYADSVASWTQSLLGLESPTTLYKDPAVYPAFNADVLVAMQAETRDFVGHLFFEANQTTLAAMLTSPSAVLTDPLYPVYGVAKQANASAGAAVELDKGQRSGLLTRASFLAIHGHANASAPVLRGKIIRENLLCQSLPAPPAGVSLMPPKPQPGSTTRALLLQHESDPSCAACHTMMDHLGFGFEHYDGIGQWRDLDSGQKVDASGSIAATRQSDQAFDGAVELSRSLGKSADVAQCVTLQMYRYAVARPVAAADSCSLAQIYAGQAGQELDIRQLMRTIATSPAFVRRAAPM